MTKTESCSTTPDPQTCDHEADSGLLSLQKEKMAMVGEIAIGVAHEINNPIAFVSSNLTVLGEYVESIRTVLSQYAEARRALASSEDAQAKEFSETTEAAAKSANLDFLLDDLDQLIKESQDGTERVKQIIADLKTFSRDDKGEFCLADINRGLEATLNIAWNELKYKAEVTKRLGDIPQIKCCPSQLNQVFMNLLINASQAIESDGEVTLETWRDDGFVCVRLSDNGCGIPEEHLEKIFGQFFTTKAVGEGTGVGLSIVRDIIDRHHATIDVASKVGEGTSFLIRLPVNGVE